MNTSTDTNPQPQSAPRAARSSPWRRGAIAIGLVAGGFVLGAASLASAGAMAWHGFHHGPRIGMIQHVVHGALENVGATTAQEDKIHDIVAAAYTEIDKGRSEHEALRKQVLDLMRAPTIDRAAVEKLRAERLAAFDAKSKTIVNAVLDAAGQLTPEQRAKLVQQAEDRMAQGGWSHGGWSQGGWSHGGWGGHHGGPAEDGPDHARNDRGDHNDRD